MGKTIVSHPPNHHFYTMWGPRLIAKLVNITPITMVYGTYNKLVTGAYKPTYNWGASHCRNFHGIFMGCKPSEMGDLWIICVHIFSKKWWIFQIWSSKKWDWTSNFRSNLLGFSIRFQHQNAESSPSGNSPTNMGIKASDMGISWNFIGTFTLW